MSHIELLLLELTDLDKEVKEKILAQIVLGSLPSTWHPFRSTLRTIMAWDPLLAFADLEEHLHVEEHREKQFKSHEEVLSAYQRDPHHGSQVHSLTTGHHHMGPHGAGVAHTTQINGIATTGKAMIGADFLSTLAVVRGDTRKPTASTRKWNCN